MLLRLLYPLARLYWYIFRPITFGVRVIIVDSQNQILLLKHTYLNGWMMPGGGVNYSESFDQAACREVMEETGVRIDKPNFMGVYKFNQEGKRDHIFVFWTKIKKFPKEFKKDKLEIAEIKTFSMNNLPSDIIPGHLRRIQEYLNNRQVCLGKW